MIRKGIKFRHSNRLIMDWQLPKEVRGERVTATGKSIEAIYVHFHRVFTKPQPGAKLWVDGNGVSWYVKPEPITGHSRTNMAYGVLHNSGFEKYRNVYWAEDGWSFIGRISA